MKKQWMARALLGSTSVGSAVDQDDRPDAQFEAGWRMKMKARLLMLLAILGLWAVAIEAKLVILQVVQHEEFVAKAKRQSEKTIVTKPPGDRGEILDRNGEIFAYSVEGYSLNAAPSTVEDAALEVQEICAALRDCSDADRADFLAKLSTKRKHTVLRNSRDFQPNAASRIQDLIAQRSVAKRPAVVWLTAESRRFYPKMDLGSQVIGFADVLGKGQQGIERRYNNLIAGRAGQTIAQVDASGRWIDTRVEVAPTAGATVELTIDLRLQHIAERELRAGVEEFKAAGGSVVILNPMTGEILAQASYPTFNPNRYWLAAAATTRDRAVTDTYEPGSTFKLVTGSAAINEGVWSTSELIDTNPGVITIQGRAPIREAKGHNYGVLTFEDVLVKSSNVGAIRIGQRIGGDRLVTYARAFGFGQSLSHDLASQTPGSVAAVGKVSDSTLASISMGYELNVTPLQVATAASVVANGGLLMEPHLLRAVVQNGRREMTEPKVLRRVISPETAATMTAIMEGVVERGTGKAAALARYRVAGKTGTAAKVIDGRYYSKTDFNVSFVGSVGSPQPAMTILVVLDTPRSGPAYGGTMAAPIFKRIAEASLLALGVMPSINPAPPIIMAANRQVLPASPFRSADLIPTITRVGGRPVMPDVRGMSLRDALRVTQALGLVMTSIGDGVVDQQSPAPGEFVEPDGAGTLQLRRLPASGRSGR